MNINFKSTGKKFRPILNSVYFTVFLLLIFTHVHTVL